MNNKPDFHPAFDMPTNATEALLALEAWSDPSCFTFNYRKAQQIHRLLSDALRQQYVETNAVQQLIREVAAISTDADVSNCIEAAKDILQVQRKSSSCEHPDPYKRCQHDVFAPACTINTFWKDGFGMQHLCAVCQQSSTGETK